MTQFLVPLCWGLSISMEKQSQRGFFIKSYTFTDEGPVYFVRNSNYFDSLTEDNAIGKFEVTNASDFKKAKSQLDMIAKALTKINNIHPDTNQNKENTNSEKLSFRVNNYSIPRTHPYYKEVSKFFLELEKKKKLEKSDTVEIKIEKKEYLKINFIKKKAQKGIKIDPNQACINEKDIYVCKLKFGHIFLSSQKT